MVGNVTGTAAPVGTPALPSEQRKADPAPAIAAPGKVVTQSGEDLPVDTRVATDDIEHTVRKLNELMRERQRNLTFRVDESSGRTVITVVDAANRVVRQIPSEEMLAASRAIELTGALLEIEA